MLPFIVSARRLAALALLLAAGPLAPAARAQSAAPFGISHMQVGLQNSWSSQMSEQTKLNPINHNQRNNHGLGLNGRLQFSLLDLLVNDDRTRGQHSFRIVDVMAIEAGAGYLREADERITTNAVWWNFGVDEGLAGLYRVVPGVDVGLKCRYSSFANATFNGRDQAYGGLPVWSGLARVGRFYGECSLMRGFNKDENYGNPTYVNVLDLKYQYGSPKGAWAPYVGLQVGMGTTTASDEYSGFNSAFSRNWVQLSIGKMTNF